jgi:Domain of unknown function (DUF4350)
MENRKYNWIIGFILTGLFLFGLIQLLMLRFSAGDVYPPYSSLRTDPLGAKALYESLAICCDLRVSRNYEPFSKIKDQYDSTVFVFGMPSNSLENIPQTVEQQVNYFISNGGRLVISCLPLLQKEKLTFGPSALDQTENLFETWGVRTFKEHRWYGSAYLNRELVESRLPRSIAIHTSLYFQPLHPDWRTIYERTKHPVLIERNFGRGSIVLSAESYFLSNEALSKEKEPVLLNWLIGTHHNLIFDEYHHGIGSDAGVMTLARKYHLEWLLIGLLFLSLLFIWNSATPFVAPAPESAITLEPGRESIAGLTNLLRRNIPASDVLTVSYREWQRTSKDVSREKQNEMELLLNTDKSKSPRHRNLPVAYNALKQIVKMRG